MSVEQKLIDELVSEINRLKIRVKLLNNILKTIMLLIFCIVIVFKSNANITKKNELFIAETTYCEILAVNGNVPNQAIRYTNQLKKFDDSYHNRIVFYSIKALGFIDGAIYQQNIRNPTTQQFRRISTDLFIKRCGISF